MFGLYIHIPFCLNKCPYCDFNSSDHAWGLADDYIAALLAQAAGQEMDRDRDVRQDTIGKAEGASRRGTMPWTNGTARQDRTPWAGDRFWQAGRAALQDSIDTGTDKKDCKPDSVYIGGGTPTALSYPQLDRLLGGLGEIFDFSGAEFTIEANPKTLDVQKLVLLRRRGVNRLSIGMQAWQDELLRRIGRIHTREDFIQCIKMAQDAGFERINADAMFNLPGQTLFDWEETLEGLLSLSIGHLSCYSLTIAEGTPFAQSLPAPLPDEEAEREMYHRAVAVLTGAGLPRYEISNFARAGEECRHNLCYWEGSRYAALGAGAYGFENGVRYSWESDIERYIQKIREGTLRPDIAETLDRNGLMSETAILSLRLARGVDADAFYKRFGIPFDKVFAGPVKKHCQNGLLAKTTKGWALTEHGFDLSNTVMEDFLDIKATDH